MFTSKLKTTTLHQVPNRSILQNGMSDKCWKSEPAKLQPYLYMQLIIYVYVCIYIYVSPETKINQHWSVLKL